MRLALALSFACIATGASAQNAFFDPGPVGATVPAPAPVAEAAPSEYSRTIGRLTPTEIIQQKAQVNAAQRQSRIAARAWYGHSQARPTTVAMPFTGTYGSQFQGRVMGRPAAYYAQRPLMILAR